jgi:hypothetical protein
MHYSFTLTRSLVRNAAIASTMLIAASITLRADSTCIGDCTPGSHLSGIGGNEDVEAGDSGFDIYFRPGLPNFSSSDSSDKQNSGSSDDYFVSGSWGDGGSLQFDSDNGSQGSNDNSQGSGGNGGNGNGGNKDFSFTQLFNAPGSGSGINSDGPIDPSPTPEPSNSALVMLGLGSAGLAAFKKLRLRRTE